MKYIIFILLTLIAVNGHAGVNLFLLGTRATLGIEYIEPGRSSEHDYNISMFSLGTEFKFSHALSLIANAGFQKKSILEGVEFKYDLLLNYNKFKHALVTAGLLAGYTNSTIAYQECNSHLSEYCRTYKKDDTGAVYGLNVDLNVSHSTVIIFRLMRGGSLDLTRVSVLLTTPF